VDGVHSIPVSCFRTGTPIWDGVHLSFADPVLSSAQFQVHRENMEVAALMLSSTRQPPGPNSDLRGKCKPHVDAIWNWCGFWEL